VVWHHDTAMIAVVANVLGAPAIPENIDGIIVPSQQPIGPEITYLFPCMAGGAVREACRPPAPNLATLFPRLDLSRQKARKVIGEWLHQVGPENVKVEMGRMSLIPRCLVGVARKGHARVISNCEHSSRYRLRNDPGRRKLKAPIRRPRAPSIAHCRRIDDVRDLTALSTDVIPGGPIVERPKRIR
jgi:hypothetical protein